MRRTLLLLAVLGAALLAGCTETANPPDGTPSIEPAPAPNGGDGAESRTEETTRDASETAVVASVTDGDTIVLADGRRVRLVQIDAPEPSQGECYGVEAGGVLARLLPPGTEVGLAADPELDESDEHGRLLRYVFEGERNLNIVLVRRGAATVYFFDGDRGRYAEALLREAKAARRDRRGLWGACPGTPFAPERGADTGTASTTPASATGNAACPGAIAWQKAASHVGEAVTVEGPVASTFYAADASGRPTFLNLGNPYPNPRRVTALIWGRDRLAFPTPPETAYAGKRICVTGEVELYEGVPEIEVTSPRQIVVAS